MKAVIENYFPKKENNIILSIYTEKAFDKIRHPLMIKNISKLGIEENVLNLIKNISRKTIANIMLNGCLFVKSGIKH